MAGVFTAIALDAAATAAPEIAAVAAPEALGMAAPEILGGLGEAGALTGGMLADTGAGIMSGAALPATAGSTAATTAGAIPSMVAPEVAGASAPMTLPSTTLSDIADTAYPDVVSRAAQSAVTPDLASNPLLQGLKDAGAWMKENPLTSAGLGYGIMKATGLSGPSSTSFTNPADTSAIGTTLGISPNFQGSHPAPPTPYKPVYQNYGTARYAKGGIIGFDSGEEVEASSTPKQELLETGTSQAPATTQKQTTLDKYLAAMGPQAATSTSAHDMTMGKGVYAGEKETANMDPWTLAKTRLSSINKAANYATPANMSAQPLGQINPAPAAVPVAPQDQAQQAPQAFAMGGGIGGYTPSPDDGTGPGQHPTDTGIMGAHQSVSLGPAYPMQGTTSSYATGGGIGSLGGYSDGGQLLKGPGDGVSDDIPATIGDKQPARLADGEFVIPARIVSELGNGSTDAGAKRLHEMMDRVQKRRSKTTGKGNIAVDSGAHKELDRL